MVSGDEDLLEILGQAQNCEIIQTHLKKLFAGINSVEFKQHPDRGTQIIAMKSSDGEVDSLFLYSLSLFLSLSLALSLIQCVFWCVSVSFFLLALTSPLAFVFLFIILWASALSHINSPSSCFARLGAFCNDWLNVHCDRLCL